MVKEVINSLDYLMDPSSQIYESTIPGMNVTTNFHPERYTNEPKKKKRTIAQFFSDMSRMGMSYDDDVVKNMRALPADKSLLPKRPSSVGITSCPKVTGRRSQRRIKTSSTLPLPRRGKPFDDWLCNRSSKISSTR